MTATSSVNDSNAIEMVHKILQLAESSEEECNQAYSKGPQQSVILLGKTGVGKSTLVNLLAQVTLKAVYDNKTAETSIYADKNPLENFKIGHSTHSETSIPRQHQINELTFWDCPGFNDNRGLSQEIASAIGIKKVFEVCKNFKIVLLLPSDALENKSNQLIDISLELNQLFLGQLGTIKSSLMLVVTKGPINQTETHCKKYIQAVIKDREERELEKISALEILSSSNICLFKTPASNTGIINTEQVRSIILDNIYKLDYADEVVANLSLSPRCLAKLLSLYEELKSSIDKSVGDFRNNLVKIIKNFASSFFSDDQEVSIDLLQNKKKQLELIIQKLDSFVEQEFSMIAFSELISICQEIAKICNRTIEIDVVSIKEQIKSIVIINKYLTKDIQIPSNFIDDLQMTVKILRSDVEKAILNINVKIEEVKAKIDSQRALEQRKIADQAKQQAAVAKKKQEELRHQQAAQKPVETKCQRKMRENVEKARHRMVKKQQKAQRKAIKKGKK